MKPESVAGLQRAASRIASILMFLVLAAVVDGFVKIVRTDFNLHPALAGQTIDLNGPLPPGAEELSQVRLEAAGSGAALELTETYQGFWMGGRMWKGRARIAPGAAPGDHVVAVLGPPDKPRNPALVYTFRVYPDAAALRADAPSVFFRHLGVEPFAAAAAFFAAALVAGAVGFYSARHVEEHMRSQGKAVIYMLKMTGDGVQISFGLGARNGLAEGGLVAVLDEGGFRHGEARVVQASDADATAMVLEGGKAELGYLVQILPPEQGGPSAAPPDAAS